MILCPRGWREWRSGDAYMYSPREGRVHGVMTYEERVAPLRTFAVLLEETLADDEEFRRLETYHVVRFITAEGEYGARVIVKGEHRGKAIAHIVAAVFVEDFSTRLCARVEAEHIDEHAALVTQLAQNDRLSLGERRRRVAFIPPKGWHPIPGLELEMVLLPPDYPKTHASITVFPAVPLTSAVDPHHLQNERDLNVGLPPGTETRTRVMTGKWKMGKRVFGEEWSSVRNLPQNQGRMLRWLVVLRDTRYVYSMKLEALDHASVQEQHDAFMEMIGTIETIPTPRSASKSTPTFEMWND